MRRATAPSGAARRSPPTCAPPARRSTSAASSHARTWSSSPTRRWSRCPRRACCQGVGADVVVLINSADPAQESAGAPQPGRAGADAAGQRRGQGARRSAASSAPTCAGAAARLLGVVRRESAGAGASATELATFGAGAVAEEPRAGAACLSMPWRRMPACVREGGEIGAADYYEPPDWIDVPLDDVRVSRQTSARAASSERRQHRRCGARMRPVIDYEQCNRCCLDLQHASAPTARSASTPDAHAAHRLRPLQGLPGAAWPCVRRTPIRAEREPSARPEEGAVMNAPHCSPATRAAAWGARLARWTTCPRFPITPQTEIIENARRLDRRGRDGRPAWSCSNPSTR